jgi:peptide deformylase
LAKINDIDFLPESRMALLTILEYPDERLRKQAAPVEKFDNELHQFVDDMLETMYAAPGIGLAATQVNVHLRVIVIDISEEKNAPLCLINPEIVERRGSDEMEEGCLSVPGIYEKVKRASSVRVRASDVNGVISEIEAEGLLAVCIQHEVDHLDGHLFVDRLSPLKRRMVRKKIKKEHRHRPAKASPQPSASAL